MKKLRLTEEAREGLEEQAQRSGHALDEYASQLIEHAVTEIDVDAALAPLRKQFAMSGTSDERLLDEIAEARERYHSEARQPRRNE